MNSISVGAMAYGLALAASLLALSNIQTTSAQAVSSFNLSQVQLTESRWMENQDRTLAYLLFVDPDRLLYNFRSNHGLDTQNATPNSGWDAPDFPFRTHAQGHFLSAWSQCYAVLKNEECRDRAKYFVAELVKCQANNEAVGFSSGYLSGFPESEIAKLEDGTLDNGNVPYYAIHKTMAGLLDVWQYTGDEAASDVLLAMASWVDSRTKQLSEEEMQAMMATEYGGMNDILALLYQRTSDERWLTAAQRFDHAEVFDPLANGRDQLNGLHANTQAQKLVGVIHEYQATGTERYLDIARNAWDAIVNAHSYAISGNSQAEHFHEPDAISGWLTDDTCETCNTYNMLKLTRELWASDSSLPHYFDFYERALLNHLLGVQHPNSDHGHITYFTPLNPGGRRGIGPAWGGGTWSNDYETFWCCQGTSLETNTKLMDSIYWHEGSKVLYVNLYIPSQLNWTESNVSILQTTEIPAGDSATLEIGGPGSFLVHLRIPRWASSGGHILINGEQDNSIAAEPGTYAIVDRQWQTGDTVTVKLPMSLHTITSNDDPSIAALAFGPTILAANYGDRELVSLPKIDINSVKRVGNQTLSFEATADGEMVRLEAFYNSHDYNYNVYWMLDEA